MSDHPFPHDVVEAVTDEHETDRARLEALLERIQEALERGDENYEYSSQHTFAWNDADAFYLYGDGIWETLADELSLERQAAAAARAVHRRDMLESARRRGDVDTVTEQFDDGAEALVVANTADGAPLFGQDV
ncbi:hypothetical protein [Natrinema sp. 74]|uniref:hypothetical protein n=1 Tax=Natrinema sp. 74 TaxID=3384159 RepID=UPI0038D4E6AB